jgi:hypothetical protein
LSIATTPLQAALCLWLLRREFNKRLALPPQEKIALPAVVEPTAPPVREPA